MVHSKASKKPRKPNKDFPLFPHTSGQWAKKIKGKRYYFGTDREHALKRYLWEKDYHLAGQTPPPMLDDNDALTLQELANRFLTQKHEKLAAGEIKPVTVQELLKTCERLTKEWGKGKHVENLLPPNFSQLRNSWARKYGPARLTNEISRTKQLFKWGYESGYLEKPVIYGPDFKPPARKLIRKARYEKGSREFSPEQLHRLMGAASPELKAMILLAINCGFGNTDCSELKKKDIALKTGWIDFPRPKTFTRRRAKLWRETIEAIEAVVTNQPSAKDKQTCKHVFITRFGGLWVKQKVSDSGNVTKDDSISKEFAKLRKATGITQAGLSFYAIRHTFETIAGNSRDQVAVDLVMGHVDDSMAARYRERIDDDRLESVAGYVHSWLYS